MNFGWLPLPILILLCGCTTAQIEKYNNGVSDLSWSIGNPSDPTLIKNVWFALNFDPSVDGQLIDSLGQWAFMRLPCAGNSPFTHEVDNDQLNQKPRIGNFSFYSCRRPSEALRVPSSLSPEYPANRPSSKEPLK